MIEIRNKPKDSTAITVVSLQEWAVENECPAIAVESVSVSGNGFEAYGAPLCTSVDVPSPSPEGTTREDFTGLGKV